MAVKMSINVCSCPTRSHSTNSQTMTHTFFEPHRTSISSAWSSRLSVAPMRLHLSSSITHSVISHTVPASCKQGVKNSARRLCANLAGWTYTDAFQQPLSCCHSLPWGRSPHGGFVGCLQGQRGGVHPEDCFCQVCSNPCKPRCLSLMSVLLLAQRRLCKASYHRCNCTLMHVYTPLRSVTGTHACTSEA